MQCKLIVPKRSKKQDLTFQNYPEVFFDDLGDLCIVLPDNVDKVENRQIAK